ncbi:hypothetical protein [Aquamicrobium sp. LC103]|uniref:hypothetical protein n=1 Tax=Aquamicrobium sp. LC103 TaxID=1120658 RepID=UPI00063E99DB|nr:hypothetical protein [Aquamicrobium sp. LC103]TKT80054.1 hypothetical protein XW59_006765 [Aquamicrobium sp. LC103]
MSILTTVGRFITELNRNRVRNSTARLISELPLDMQKDIGWPSAYYNNRGRPNPVSGLGRQ